MAHEILIVDDEPDIRALLEGILSDEGFKTRQAHDADSALAALSWISGCRILAWMG